MHLSVCVYRFRRRYRMCFLYVECVLFIDSGVDLSSVSVKTDLI